MPTHNPHVAEGHWRGKPARFRRDRLIVSVRPGAPVDDVLNDVRSAATSHLGANVGLVKRPGRRWAVLTFPPHPQAETVVPALAEALAYRPNVLYAEPDFEGTLHVTPNDERFSAQNNWTDVVEMEKAWDVTQGSDQVLIAVFDSGISISPGATDPDHAEMTGARFIVRHTFKDASVKHDYAADDDVPADEYGHGTHVTGIIAATPNNTVGVAGINSVSRVYIARVVDEYGSIFSSFVRLAMVDLADYVTENGISRVIVNMSFGFWQETDNIIEMRDDSNTGVFLLCVGSGSDLSGKLPDFPAQYASKYDHIMAVGSVDAANIQLPHLDNYSTITLFAPGLDIISVAPGYKCALWDPASAYFDPYPALSGTSPAAAIVSGVASLLWSANLALTPAQIKDRLVNSATSLVDGRNEVKVVNAFTAVANAGIA
jgi:subtilisin family serine protease